MTDPELGELRDRMVAQVVTRSGRPVSDAVAQALRVVPRHVFLPELAPELAYRNEAIVTRRSADGQPTSSSSQPTRPPGSPTVVAWTRGRQRTWRPSGNTTLGPTSPCPTSPR